MEFKIFIAYSFCRNISNRHMSLFLCMYVYLQSWTCYVDVTKFNRLILGTAIQISKQHWMALALIGDLGTLTYMCTKVLYPFLIIFNDRNV